MIVVGSKFERDVGTSVDEMTFAAIAVADPKFVFVGFRRAGGYHFPSAPQFPGRRPLLCIEGDPMQQGALHF